jgi:malate permease and related proteins
MLEIIINVILPIFLTMACGFVYGRTLAPDTKTIASLIVYLFAPALIIEGFVNVQVDEATLIQVGMVTVVTACILAAIVYMVGRVLLRLDRFTTGALILSVILFNGANYGLPFNRFALGLEAEQIGIVYYSISILVTNTLGIYLISDGGSALKNIFRTPLIYATVGGLAFYFLGVSFPPQADVEISLIDSFQDTLTAGLPSMMLDAPAFVIPLPLARLIDVLADGTVPVMLILIGVQISRIKLQMDKLRVVAVGVAGVLLLAPLVAFLVSILFNLEGLARDVGLIQHAMPTAVIASALATEFDSDSDLVAGVLVVSTAISVLTLSVLVTFGL